MGKQKEIKDDIDLTQKTKTEKGKAERIQKLDQMLFSKHWQITIRVIAITLGTITIFGSTGYLIDQYLDTKPIGLILAIIISFPISQFLIYKVFQKITQ